MTALREPERLHGLPATLLAQPSEPDPLTERQRRSVHDPLTRVDTRAYLRYALDG